MGSEEAGLALPSMGVGTNAWTEEATPALELVARRMVEGGARLVDTAEVYGRGASERAVGRLFGGEQPLVPGPVIITTKFMPLPWRRSGASLRRALRASLDRLALSRVDLYLLHFPRGPLPDWFQALADAVQAGLARGVGVSNCDRDTLLAAHDALHRRGVPLVCNQVQYSLLDRTIEDNGVLQACRERGIAVVAYRPLVAGMLAAALAPTGTGLLMGAVRRIEHHRHEQRCARIRDTLAQVADRVGHTPSQVALNWVIGRGAIPIPGARTEAHAVENLGALGWSLDDDTTKMLESSAS